MATRPSGNPPIWAQTTNYPAGADPWSGMATKVTSPTATTTGQTPETGWVAEYINDELNVLSEWVEWLSFGSFAAGLDAHVIETDTDGFTAVAQVVVGGTASVAGIAALDVTENAGGAVTTSQFRNTTDGFAILATASGTDEVIRATQSGTGAAIVAQIVAGNGNAVEGTGFGTGAGVTGTPGATGDGVIGTCTGSGKFGVSGSSSAANPNSFGVHGQAAQTAAGGVFGRNVNAGADTTNSLHSGVLGVSTDSTGVFAISTNGYALWAQSDTTTPARAPLHIEPQDADPITKLEGDIWYHSGEDQLKGRIDGTTMGIWATGHGYAYVYGENAAQVSTDSSSEIDIITASFASNMEPREVGSLMTATVCFEFGGSTAGSAFQWNLLDFTATDDVIATRIEQVHNSGANADDRYLTAKAQYTIPIAGPRTFKLQIRSVDGISFARIRRASIEFTGSHG